MALINIDKLVFFWVFLPWDELGDGKMNKTLKRYWERSRARAGMQMLRLPRALAAAGGKARKQILFTSDSSLILPRHHSSLLPTFVPHPSHPPSPSNSLRRHSSCFFSFLPPRSLLTVESPKWQCIKHLGTEAPRVLINASLAWKMITSRRGWVLDERGSSTNEMKISFLSKVGCFFSF